MAIDLSKNNNLLLSAWKDVLNDKTPTNWALFGYEGQTNILKVISTGSDGIEELTEDLNSGKIMYAFVKVHDPKTSLDKCVLINWQGEGANTLRKGMCANHLRDVENFFTGAHLTLNARNDEEVEPQLIIDRISKTGSAYSFKSAAPARIESDSAPIGTAYKRVNPVKEIDSRERDRFWRKEEAEEKRRVEEERARKETERVQLEHELKDRELRETAKRDAESSLRNHVIDQIKETERNENDLAAANDDANEEDVISTVGVNNNNNNRSDVIRKQRNQETHDLIAQRTIDARSIFEKNTAAGQQQVVKRIPEKPVRNSILKAQAQAEYVTSSKSGIPSNDVNKVLQHNKTIEEQQSDDEEDQYSTIKRSPKDAEKKSATTITPTTPQELINNELNKQEVFKQQEQQQQQQITDQQFVDEYLYGLSTPGLQARALYDYQAADDTEITFDPGDVITNVDQVDEGWWQGLAPDGSYGLFPANYVELIR